MIHLVSILHMAELYQLINHMNWHAQTKFLLTTSLNSIQLSILTIAIAHHSCYQQIILQVRAKTLKLDLLNFMVRALYLSCNC